MSDGREDLMGHDYDGIQEYDNPLPGWWTAVFALTAVFAAGYWVYYDVLEMGAGRESDYAAEVKEADTLYAQFKVPDLKDEEVLVLASDPKRVERGRAVFTERCAVCHGDKAEGKVGPNLTDSAWLHGGKPGQVYHTITHGVVAKGMPAWRSTLVADDLKAVTAFVWSVHDTQVTGKAPQGTVEGPDAVAPAAGTPAATTPATGQP
jgi:cytochrome c oxidase cbb3-type subunit 3